MKKWFLVMSVLVFAQAQNPAPSGQVTGIQSISVPESEGGGALIYLSTEQGLIGPFQRLPALPKGATYGSTEVAVPSWPGEPCQKGNWSRSDEHLYLCVSKTGSDTEVPVNVWRRVAFDKDWDSRTGPQ